MARRSGLLAFLLLAVGFASAQDLPPPSPTDLVRGLRENGMADLALEYLGELATKAPPDVAKVLPLERAKCRLELANTESDDTLRAALVTEAKREFDSFVKGNAGHPRLPEAAVALAKLQTLDGKTQIQRANRLPAEQRAAEVAKARPLFVAAGKQYSTAADVLKKLADAEEPNTPRHKEATQNYLQAVLDQGINQYLLAESYETPMGKEAAAKAAAAKDAGLIFESVWSRYKDYPQGWVARAWAAESLRVMDERLRAESAFKALLDEGAKAKTSATAAGVRMARFFNLRDDFDKNGGQGSASNDRLRVRNVCRDWLRDYGGGRPTSEESAVRYYLGRVCMNEAMKRENLTIEQVKPADPKEKPTEKVIGVKESGLAMLREAEAQFRVLVRTENEYTERATRQRPAALRWLVGNPDRPPAQFPTFDDCYMASLVQQESARAAANPAERAAHLDKAIALLERANTLPIPPESVRDAARADLDLARTYYAAGRIHAAAVYAEHLARTARSPAPAAKAAAIALDAYARAARQTAGEDAQAVDRDRRISLATLLEKVAPNEPETDSARLQLGGDLYRAGRKAEAFETFARVSTRSPRLAQARLFEGIAAFDLTRPLGPDETRADDLPAAKKQSVFARAVADLSAVPPPPDGVKDSPTGDATPVSDYFNLRLQLAQLHITQAAKGYPLAEETAVSSSIAAAKHSGLSADEKARFAMRYEVMRIRAVFGQAMPLYQQGKYAEAAERFSPLLTEVLKAGPAAKAVKADQGDLADLAKTLDADRIRLLIVPTLNARVREGAAAKTAELLDELKKFGGDLSTSARVVQQGVASIRPTVEALRKEKKDDEAEKLVGAVVGMVTKLAAEPNLPTDVRLNLGRSFKDLGEYARAVELLAAVPAPENKESLKGELKPADTETDAQAKQREADNAAAPLYRTARLDLARSYRLDKKFDKAGEVLDDALGKEGAPKGKIKPRTGGWASRFPEYRKEAILLIEAKAAAATDVKTAAPLWNEALGNWTQWAGEYLGVLNQLNQKYGPNKAKVERLGFRLRLIDELAQKEKIDFAEEKKQVTKDLEQAEKEVETAVGDVAAAAKAVDAATSPTDIEKAREKVDAAREAAEATNKKTAELKARLPMLDEFAKLAKPDWADEARKVQKEIDPVQKEMGEQERRMNPLKAVWQDVLAEQMRCLMAAMSAFYKTDAGKLADFTTKHGKTIADFEKGNRPLPANVRQKLYDLIDANKALKDEYRKAGGIDLLAPPAVNQ